MEAMEATVVVATEAMEVATAVTAAADMAAATVEATVVMVEATAVVTAAAMAADMAATGEEGTEVMAVVTVAMASELLQLLSASCCQADKCVSLKTFH